MKRKSKAIKTGQYTDACCLFFPVTIAGHLLPLKRLAPLLWTASFCGGGAGAVAGPADRLLYNISCPHTQQTEDATLHRKLENFSFPFFRLKLGATILGLVRMPLVYCWTLFVSPIDSTRRICLLCSQHSAGPWTIVMVRRPFCAMTVCQYTQSTKHQQQCFLPPI